MSWVRFAFKDGRVWARVDGAGAPIVRGGLVEIRYRPDDARTYRAAASNLRPLESDAPDGPSADAGVPGVPAGAARRTSLRRKAPPVERVPEGAVAAFTDGACTGNPGPGGWGVVLRYGEHVRELSGYLGRRSTNNIAELTAVKEALLAITDRNLPVFIHTDSTYAMGVLSQGWKARANQALVAEIRQLLAGFPNSRFVKVPAHSGVPDNERADVLARGAITQRAEQAAKTREDR